MKKNRKIKSAAFAGAMLTIITVLLMLGSTMAWFQDTEVVINTYTFGELNVDIVDDAEKVIGGATLKFIKPGGSGLYEENEYLFEPGATFQLQEFYIKNSGDVPLTYRLKLDTGKAVVEGGRNLLDAMDISATIGDEPFDLQNATGTLAAGEKSGAVKISFHMRESAGNEYQNLCVSNLIVKVLAVQTEGIPDSEVENAFQQAAQSAPQETETPTT